MAGAFNIVAQLQLQAPSNLNSIVGQIQQKLSNINATINLQVSSGGVNALQALNSALASVQANLQTTQTQASTTGASLNRLGTSYAQAGNAASTAGSQIIAGMAQMQALGGSANAAASAMENFGLQAGLAARRYSAFLIAGGAIVTFMNQIRSAVGEAINFQREMVRLSQVGENTGDSLRGMEDTVTRLATTWGVSSKELLGATIQLRQAGLTASDTKIALEELAKTGLAPSFGSLQDTTDGLISAMNQFKLSANEAGKVLGAINAVSTQYAVSSKDIIDAVRRTGGAFHAAGGDINQLIALFGAIRSTSRESAESIGSSLRTILVRMQRSSVIDDLEKLGVQLRYTREEASRLGNVNLSNQFVGPYEAVRRLQEGLRGLQPTDSRFVAISEELGGYRQISKTVPMLQEGARMQSIYNTAISGTASTTKSAEQAQEAFLVRIGKVKEEFSALIRTVTESKGFQVFLDMIIQMTSGLTKLAQVLSPIIPLLGLFATFKLAQGVGQFAVGLAGGFGGRSPRFASGGIVPGTGDSDTVHGMLTPGEYVIRKDAARGIGYDNLERLNRGASPRMNRYAAGGEVRLKDNESIGQLFTRQGKGGLKDPQVGFDSAEVPLSQMSDSSIFMRTMSNYLQSYPVENEAKRIQRANPNLSDKDALLRAKEDKSIIASKAKKLVSNYTAVANVSNMTLKDPHSIAQIQDKATWTPIDSGISSAVQSITGRPSVNKVSDDQNAKDTIAGYLLEGVVSSYTGIAASGGRSPIDFRKIEGSLATLRPFIDFPGNFVPNNIDTKLTKTSPTAIVQKALNAGLFNTNQILADMERSRAFRLPGREILAGKPEFDPTGSPLALSAISTNVRNKGYASGGLVRFAEGGEPTFPLLSSSGEPFMHLTAEQIDQVRKSKDESTYTFAVSPEQRGSFGQFGRNLREKETREAKKIKDIAGLSSTLHAPTGGDSLFLITYGSAGELGKQTKGIDLSKASSSGLSDTAKNYLASKEIKNIVGSVDVRGITSQSKDEFNSQFREPISQAISGVFSSRFGANTGIDYGLDKNQVNSIMGQVFEKYISGVFGVQSAGSGKKFDFENGF
jgi:hypothetical protein